jgi:hypothetical protein
MAVLLPVCLPGPKQKREWRRRADTAAGVWVRLRYNGRMRRTARKAQVAQVERASGEKEESDD